ncbi:hypothetical protein ACET3Z_004943 [Daucus carota]
MVVGSRFKSFVIPEIDNGSSYLDKGRIPARMAFKLYVSQSGLRNNRKEFIWHHTEVQCPQQVGGTECGFFVMSGKWFLVLGVMAKRKSMRFERFGLSFLLLNVSSRMAINAKTGVQKKELQESGVS